MATITLNPADWLANDEDPKYVVGTKAEYAGDEYLYVRYENGTGPVTASSNLVAFFLTTSTHVVTCDVSDTKVNLAAGVLQTAITDGYYGWLKTKGDVAALKTNGDDDITAGDALVGVADGTVNSVAAGTAPTGKIVGWAVANDTDADNTVYARIDM